MAAALMIQGTGSDVGKSLIVAGLCRAFARRGLRVRPFKPQNMSNNAAVTADGGEIGRAQALQARACGVPLHSDMNPVLLKPEAEAGAQIIVQGRVMGRASARAFQAMKPSLLPRILESYRRLAAAADLVLVEGAGSAAEINLRAADIANMGFAEAAGLPVIVVADIDRGGVIAQLVGTHALLDGTERARVQGFIVNKFRGDSTLFAPGMDEIASRTGWPGLGLVPYLREAARLPAEDAMALGVPGAPGAANTRPILIAVLQLARIANFDDLDPLTVEPDVCLRMIRPGEAIPGEAGLVIVPGSKATLADLAFLRAQGWDIDIRAHHRRGGMVVGICGGYQMLGRRIVDADGVEGAPESAEGLGLLDIETVLTPDKRLVETEGREIASGAPVRGFEMHMGRTGGAACARPWLRLASGPDGAVSADGRIMGCYLHGLFAADDFRHAFLSRLKARTASGAIFEAEIESALDTLAQHLETHVDCDRLLAVAGAVPARALQGERR